MKKKIISCPSFWSIYYFIFFILFLSSIILFITNNIIPAIIILLCFMVIIIIFTIFFKIKIYTVSEKGIKIKGKHIEWKEIIIKLNYYEIARGSSMYGFEIIQKNDLKHKIIKLFASKRTTKIILGFYEQTIPLCNKLPIKQNYVYNEIQKYNELH